MPNSGKRCCRGFPEIGFAVDEGKGMLNPSRDMKGGQHLKENQLPTAGRKKCRVDLHRVSPPCSHMNRTVI